MIKQFAVMVMLVLLVGSVLVWRAPEALADGGGTITNQCDKYAGLTNRISSCIRDSLEKATGAYFNPTTGFYHYVSRAIGALITISISIYGVMASMGMIEKVGRDTIMLLLKIALIGYFSTNADMMYRTLVVAMDYTAAEVVKFTPSSGSATGYSGGSKQSDTNFSQMVCMQNMKEAQAKAGGGGSTQTIYDSNGNKVMTVGTVGGAVVGPWMGMDCLLDSVIGIKDASTGGPKGTADSNWLNTTLDPNKTGLSRGMLMVFFSGMQTSIVGVILGIVGFVFIWGLVMLILKALFVYIAGYLGIALLMILAPLFIPLALFQATKSYFDKWIRLLIGFTLQPVIVLVFISFSIAAIDLATFSGHYSIVYAMAGNASRVKGFNLNDYMEKNDVFVQKKKEIVQNKTAAGGTDSTATVGKVELNGALTGVVSSKCSDDNINNDKKLKPLCESYSAITEKVNTIDWDKLAAARAKQGPEVQKAAGVTSPGQQICNEIMASAIFCGIVVFVMNGLFKVVPAIAQDLLGDYQQSPDIFKFHDGKGSTLPGMGKIPDMAKGLQDKLSSMVGTRKDSTS